jgi:protein O-mannosyl-transferase
MLVILTLCLLGTLIYSNSFYNSFHFDDFPHIVNNISIRNLYDFHQILSNEPTRAVAYFSFALNYHWGALNVWGYHALSLLIHIATSILVWQFMRLTVKNAPWTAFFVAVIFLTHPLQTQAVNYIYQRAALLAAFFYMASMVLYARAALRWEASPGSKRGQLYYAGSLGCAALSMLSKENAVSLPVMICLYQWFFFRGQKAFDWKRTVPFFLLLLIVPFSWGLLNLQTLTGIGKTVKGISQGLPVHQYALTQAKVILTYLKLLILPFHQRAEYDFTAVNSLFDASVLGSILLLAVILGAAVFLRNRLKLLSFGIFWFFISLMPESSFWPNRDLIYEHRLYLPLVGFSIFVSSGIFYLLQAQKTFLAVRILFILVIGYSFLTYQRNKVWKDEFTLWDDVAHRSPNDVRAYLNRGAIYQTRGDLYHAMMDYNMVIGLGPVDAVTLSNRGSIFSKIGRPDLALANYNLAIKINPSYAGTYFNRGLLYKNEGKFDLALADFNKALAFEPNDDILYKLKAETEFLKGASDKNENF